MSEKAAPPAWNTRSGSAQMAKAMQKIAALIVDDHEDFQHLIAEWIKDDARIEISGFAGTGEAALEQTDRLHPNLVILDVRLPGMDGITALRRIKARSNAPCVIVVSLYNDPFYRMAAREAGAEAFVPKTDFATMLIPTVRALFPLEDDRS